MIEIDAKELFDGFMSAYIDEMAKKHRKRCDECWGDGYYGYPCWDDEDTYWIPCPRCNGSGLQYAS